MKCIPFVGPLKGAWPIGWCGRCWACLLGLTTIQLGHLRKCREWKVFGRQSLVRAREVWLTAPCAGAQIPGLSCHSVTAYPWCFLRKVITPTGLNHLNTAGMILLTPRHRTCNLASFSSKGYRRMCDRTEEDWMGFPHHAHAGFYTSLYEDPAG
jgi:hypothetical protein